MNEAERVFSILQDLDMKPTVHNVSIMGRVFELLLAINEKLGAGGGTENTTEEGNSTDG